MYNNSIIHIERYPEVQVLDELLRELQDETPNADWGYWHFSVLNVEAFGSLEKNIHDALSLIPKHKEPFNVNSSTGTKTYNSILDLHNLSFEPVSDLKAEILAKAEHWSHYEGPASFRKAVSKRFYDLKDIVADKLVDFLNSKHILDIKLAGGIDTFYSFGGDHCGDDILVQTKAGTYVIHFGFSS